MVVTMVMVISLNGKITNGDNSEVTEWTSLEDQKHFREVKKSGDAIIVGSTTYEASRPHLKLSSDLLRVVMTRSPQKYQGEAVKDQLEFTSVSPPELIKQLEGRGFKSILVTGGSHINGLFFQHRMVDKVILTIEPKLFGSGTNLLSDLESEVSLKLEKVEKLNDKGTLLVEYLVIKD